MLRENLSGSTSMEASAQASQELKAMPEQRRSEAAAQARLPGERTEDGARARVGQSRRRAPVPRTVFEIRAAAESRPVHRVTRPSLPSRALRRNPPRLRSTIGLP